MEGGFSWKAQLVFSSWQACSVLGKKGEVSADITAGNRKKTGVGRRGAVWAWGANMRERLALLTSCGLCSHEEVPRSTSLLLDTSVLKYMLMPFLFSPASLRGWLSGFVFEGPYAIFLISSTLSVKQQVARHLDWP